MHAISTTILSILLGIPLCAQADQGKQWAQHVSQTKYPLAEAVQKSLKEAGQGVPFKAELELDKGKLVYSIDLAQGTQTCNVVLDAAEGTVVEKETEDGDESALVAACKTSLAAAIEAAIGKTKRQAIEATMRLSDGKALVDVRVFDAASMSVTTVCVDGTTGTVLAAVPPDTSSAQGGAQGQEKKWTDVFHVTPDELSSTGRNTFMILEPGYKLTLQGKEGKKNIELVVTVLKETRKVDGVETRIVEERESEDGQLVEISRNFFAISKRTASVYYFGEDVDMYKDGKVVSHEGAWLSGEKGAHFGIFLPGDALLGARFYQEIAPDVAMDRAEIVSLTEAVDTPSGKYDRVMKYEETTPLEKAIEYKWFAPGIGLIQDANLKLVKIEK